MPEYEFKCSLCSHEFTVKHSISMPHPSECPECAGDIYQIYSPVPALYKSKGFFSTDNKKDTRVRGESGALGRRVSETDISNIDEETPTRIGEKDRPKMTPTRPKPIKARKGGK